MRQPGKMLPALAARVIEAFTSPGALVLDPMCGIGTTLVEAVHLGRSAAGMPLEPPAGARPGRQDRPSPGRPSA
ncbi:DNA methyltransferase [Actinomadura rubrobrunea]|uniref:DNA methyltransferase n=1 Tax=Actinomadura rubrobrunea TaxID=115335 RepID=UPI000A00640F